MRLLIDTVNVTSPGGSQLLLELARSAASRCPSDSEVVFLTGPDVTGLPESDRLRIVVVERARGWIGLWRWFRRGLPELASECGADVVYSLSGILSRPLCRSFGTVNTINNMLPFTPEHIRNFRPFSMDRIRMSILRRLYVWSSVRADALVVPSRHGLETLSRFAGDLSAKTFVAMNPVPEYVVVDPANPPPHPYGGKPYLLYLSVVYWYKNHLGLIEGYRRALASGADLPDLIFAGPAQHHDCLDRIRRTIREQNLENRVRYLGLLPREDIPAWLHHAVANVFASTCETSSFVQAEIVGARGVMACSNVPPMPEVAGPAAELFDPRDPDSIAETIVGLCRNPARRDELRRLAGLRAEEFTPEACGDGMWKAATRADDARRSRSRV